MTIWQPFQKLLVLKYSFHTFSKSCVGFHYDGLENHQIAPCYKGVDETNLLLSTIWQPYQKLLVLKRNFHTFIKPGVNFHYESGFGNHQIASRYKCIDQTNLMSY